MEKIKFKKFAMISFASVMLLGALGLSACGKAEDVEGKTPATGEQVNAPEEQVKTPEENGENAPTEEISPLPDSILYYGEVLEIITGEDGSISQIHMNSQADGELVINVGSQTFWINSGEMKADDSATLEVGEKIYVFHSPITTMSLPAQSAGFAIVRNIPMDARCAMYHEIEEVTETENGLSIVTNNGEIKISVDAETVISNYDGSEASIEGIKAGGHMMVRYDENPELSPENPRAFQIMLLPVVE